LSKEEPKLLTFVEQAIDQSRRQEAAYRIRDKLKVSTEKGSWFKGTDKKKTRRSPPPKQGSVSRETPTRRRSTNEPEIDKTGAVGYE
jgi:hypothetical protein